MNNKYYLAIVQNDTIKALYDYDGYDAALAAYHAELAVRSETRTSTKCAILNSELEVIKREIYIAATTAAEGE